MFARTPRTPFRQDLKDNTGLSIIDTWTTNYKEEGNSLRLAYNHGIPSIQSIYKREAGGPEYDVKLDFISTHPSSPSPRFHKPREPPPFIKKGIPGPADYHPIERSTSPGFTFNWDDISKHGPDHYAEDPGPANYKPNANFHPIGKAYEFHHPSPRFQKISLIDPVRNRGPGAYVKVEMEAKTITHFPLSHTKRDCCQPSFYKNQGTFKYNTKTDFVERNKENNVVLTSETKLQTIEIKSQIKEERMEKAKIRAEEAYKEKLERYHQYQEKLNFKKRRELNFKFKSKWYRFLSHPILLNNLRYILVTECKQREMDYKLNEIVKKRAIIMGFIHNMILMRRIRKIQNFLIKRHRYRCRKRLERNALIIKPFVMQVILKNNIKLIHIKMEVLRKWLSRWIYCKRECFKLFEDLGVYLNSMNKEKITKKILKKYEGKKKPMFNYMGEKIASNPKKKKKIKLNITEEKVFEISHKIYDNLKEQNKYSQIIKRKNSEKKYTIYRMGTFHPKVELYLSEFYDAYFADYKEYKRKEAEEEEANRPKPKPPPSQPSSRRTSQISDGNRKSRISILRRKSRISTASKRNSEIVSDKIPETIQEEESIKDDNNSNKIVEV